MLPARAQYDAVRSRVMSQVHQQLGRAGGSTGSSPAARPSPPSPSPSPFHRDTFEGSPRRPSGPSLSPGSPAPGTGDSALASKLDGALKGTGLEGQGATIADACAKEGVPPDMMMAMLQKESSLLSPENTLSRANNNPGNLRYADWESQFGGQPGEGGFTHFPTVADGVRAMAHLLGTSYGPEVQSRDWNSLISRYAPASDGNDVGLYVSQMQQWSQEWAGKLGL
ncbi:MAG TPA: hypothetical protein VND93_25035 [Myxococcales bacterium]|nr:hypothetical protein [Myxococcales bacterium]